MMCLIMWLLVKREFIWSKTTVSTLSV